MNAFSQPRAALGLALAASLILLATVRAAAGQDPQAVLRRADRALDGLQTLRAEFVQRVRNPLLEKTSTGRGTLLYRAPDRFRIEYTDPAGDVVVNDGRQVWIYLPSSQPGQVIRQPADRSAALNPLTYLRDLRAGYRATDAGQESIAGHPTDHLALLPNDPTAQFETLDVWVDRESGLLRQVRTSTSDGVETTYTFGVLEPGTRIDAARFRFRVPRGVEVFDE